MQGQISSSGKNNDDKAAARTGTGKCSTVSQLVAYIKWSTHD